MGTGITLDSLKMRVLLGERYNPAKSLLFGKSIYYLAKPILHGESEKLLKHFFAHVILIEINRERNQFKVPDF